MRACVIYRNSEDNVCLSFAREIDGNPKIVKIADFDEIAKNCEDCDVIFLRDIDTLHGNLPKFLRKIGKKVVVIK